MYNEIFLQKVISEYGVDQAIIFCQIESEKCDALFNEMDMGDLLEPSDVKYERDWWKERAEKLKNNKDYVRITKEPSECNQDS